MLIRRALPSEGPKVRSLITRILGRCTERDPTIWEPSIVADRDGELVGHVSMVIRNNRPEIRNFVIDESCRHTTLPAMLFMAIEQEVAKAGYIKYHGVIEKSNPYFRRIADKWGVRCIAETDIDWIMEGNILRTSGISRTARSAKIRNKLNRLTEVGNTHVHQEDVVEV